MRKVWSFCKICRMYHVDFNNPVNNLDRRFETHLSEAERIDALSFNIYRKEIENLKGVFLIFVHANKQGIEYIKGKYPQGAFDKDKGDS